MHLTNFSLNKNSENYVAPEENFMDNDEGSKRLLTTLWKQLEENGVDVDTIKEKIADTLRKSIITMEPYLIHSYHQRVKSDHTGAKCF